MSTEGFRRLIWRHDGSLYGEFYGLSMAHLLTVDDGVSDLDAVSYSTGQTLRFCNDDLSDDYEGYHQLMGARHFGGPKRSKFSRAKRKYRVK